jgi:uncharacterized protein DUF3485
MTQTTPNNPSRSQSRFLALAVIGILLITSVGYVYGRLSQRWGPSPNLQAAADHLQTFPKQLGDWNFLEELSMEESTVDMLECAGYVLRRYQNQTTGDTVTITIIVGPPGPIAVHTPEICYSSRAYSIKDKRKIISFDNGTSEPHTFWQTAFRSTRIATNIQHVYYAWSTGDTWQASKRPRYQFGGLPMLYKIQLAGTLATSDRDPCKQFLEALFQSGWHLTNQQPPANPKS